MNIAIPIPLRWKRDWGDARIIGASLQPPVSSRAAISYRSRGGAPPELDKAPFFIEYKNHATSAELISLEFLSNYPEILNGSRQH
jgi:hypothetical protein